MEQQFIGSWEEFKKELPKLMPCERIPLSNKKLHDSVGGGWPVGRQAVVYSKDTVGTTAISLMVASGFITAGMHVVYLDFDMALDGEVMTTLGFEERTSPLFHYQPRLSTYEDFNRAMTKYINMKGLGLIVVNSETSIVPTRLLSGIEQTPPHAKARETSLLELKYKHRWSAHKQSVLWICRSRTRVRVSNGMHVRVECGGAQVLKKHVAIKANVGVCKYMCDAFGKRNGSYFNMTFEKNTCAPRMNNVEITLKYARPVY